MANKLTALERLEIDIDAAIDRIYLGLTKGGAGLATLTLSLHPQI